MSLMIFYFFFNDTATTEIYTLSLHDALPIWFGDDHDAGALGHVDERHGRYRAHTARHGGGVRTRRDRDEQPRRRRSEEHTSELQSRQYLVCRLLLEKKNILTTYRYHPLPYSH